MECNRDEALRAKTIAEQKLVSKDFAGAKKFALKAQTLYPGLDGISQILTTLDVFISAENKISGETDWYGVFGVNPSADEETIRKQYRKFALLLHPDKNKSVGADNAFKIISEAWGLLSDKAKRLAYNQRRGAARGFQQRVQMHTGGSSSAPPTRPNGIFGFATKAPKPQNNPPNSKPPTPKPTPTTPVPPQRQDTFWTICHRCKMHYEYLKVYLNHTLLCPNCREAFMASETAPPANFSKSAPQKRQQQPASSVRPSRPPQNVPVAQKSGPAPPASNHYQQRPFSGTSSGGGSDSSTAAKVAAKVVQQAQDKLKRAYNESHANPGWEQSAQKRRLDDDNKQYGTNYKGPQGNGGFGIASGSGPGSSRFYGFPGTFRRPTSNSDLTISETRNMLNVRARKDIVTKLSSWSLETKEQESKKQRQKSPADIPNGNGVLSATKVTGQQGKVENTPPDDNLSKEEEEEDDTEVATMNVPDPDFHDFDQDRAEGSFGDNEVWSAYDDDDGMPRFYALVNKVISRNPFKLRISWLNSKSTSEFGTIDWVGSGFYKTCGEFRVGKYEICKSMNSFSQKVVWAKGPRGSIIVVPQKGDVWALYKNWKPDWNELTPDEVIHKYDMVTVLDDYNEKKGVRVAPLMKVAGFKTVFRPNFDQEAIKKIPNEEMLRFSHRVPNHLLTGLESPNAPKGCLELDPAATPLELLQVITKDGEVADKENGAEEVLKMKSVVNCSVDEIGVNFTKDSGGAE